MREFHRARIPMGSRGRFLDYVRSGSLIETYMARKRMAHSALRKYVSLERAALMGAFSYLSLFSRCASPTDPRPSLLLVHRSPPDTHPKRHPTSPFLFVHRIISDILLQKIYITVYMLRYSVLLSKFITWKESIFWGSILVELYSILVYIISEINFILTIYFINALQIYFNDAGRYPRRRIVCVVSNRRI